MHGDRGPLDEPACLGPVLLGGQRVQVGERVGDHDAGHALGPVQPGEAVGVLDQAGRAAQRPPQLVHHAHVGAAGGDLLVGERGGGVDHAEPVRPGAQHRGGQQLVAGRADPGDVNGDRGGVQVDRPGGGAVEHPRQAAGAQQVEGEDQVGGPVLERGGGVGAGGGAHGVRAFLQDVEDVGDGRLC